jgi:hypothetical protein
LGIVVIYTGKSGYCGRTAPPRQTRHRAKRAKRAKRATAPTGLISLRPYYGIHDHGKASKQAKYDGRGAMK